MGTTAYCRTYRGRDPEMWGFGLIKVKFYIHQRVLDHSPSRWSSAGRQSLVYQQAVPCAAEAGLGSLDASQKSQTIKSSYFSNPRNYG